MGSFIDLSGQRFGRLLVLRRGESGRNTYGRPITKWECRCDCGNVSSVVSSKLSSGHTTSCGCFHREQFGDSRRTHGKRNTSAYRSWSHMKDRCLNPSNPKFHLWGGRGITVCDEWRESFEAFHGHIGDCPPGMTIDRIDNTRGYEPGNVRWATPSQQANNTRLTKRIAFRGEDKTMTELARVFGCSRDAIKLRLRRGQSIEQIAQAFEA